MTSPGGKLLWLQGHEEQGGEWLGLGLVGSETSQEGLKAETEINKDRKSPGSCREGTVFQLLCLPLAEHNRMPAWGMQRSLDSALMGQLLATKQGREGQRRPGDSVEATEDTPRTG